MTLKFRAWHHGAGNPMFEGYWEYSDETFSLSTFFDNVANQDMAVEVMQFTGLTDKNGKDIYCGDLITNGSGRIGRVLWHDISGAWDSEAQSPDGTHVGFNTYHWKDMIEVIGNIHQHSHLLGGNNND